METLLGDMVDEKLDSFNITIDERSGVRKTLQKVAVSKEPSENVGKTHSESDTQEPLIGRGWSIFRVPAHVREVDNGAYSPRTVSIGPFHHHNDQPATLRALEVQKKRFLSRLQKRMSSEVYVRVENAMKEMEEQTRKWYPEEFEGIDSDAFVEMMLLDGCFIVELLRLYTKRSKSYQEQGNDVRVEEPILETRWMVPNIGRDLLMLENQLPMFLLQKIFDITTWSTSKKSEASLIELALRFFEPLRPGKDKLANDIVLNTKEKQHPHLLALFQSTFMTIASTTPNDNQRSRPDHSSCWNSLWSGDMSAPERDGFNGFCSGDVSAPEKDGLKKYEKIPGKGWVHNAKTLTYAGVRFRKKSGNNFLDIEYKNTILKIPTLFIDDGTSTLFRNMIAYEQISRSATPYFSCLAVFLDSIVDTVDDLNILRHAGIIKQAKGGDQEVVDLFNSLTKEVEIDMDDDCYIIKQIQEINRHYRTHEAMVRFYRILSKVNFKRIVTTYISTLLTLIYIWSAIRVCKCKDGHKGLTK